MSASAAFLNCGIVINSQNTLGLYDAEKIGMMNVAASPGTFSQSSMDSQDSSSNMSSPSPMSTLTLSPHSYQQITLGGVNAMSSLVGFPPYLKIIEQPVEKFRFRYKSEMLGTHGSILGRSSEKNRRKTYPTVELCNYDGAAIVRCSLYTAQPQHTQRTPHTHRLVVRHDCEDKDDPHEIAVGPDVGYVATFQGMGIIHTAKKHIADELENKKRFRFLEELQCRIMNVTMLSKRDEINIRTEAEAEAKKMNLNSVSLMFEALVRENGVLVPICQPVFSSTINNMKSALTGELKICRIDKYVSSCTGNEEVFILVEKVGKKNIKIKFFELDDEDNEIWCDYGKFSELDVHHQYAIVFRTPPYRDTDIEKTVDVFLQLYRPTDGDCSEPIKFSYKPSDKIGRSRKRARTSVTDDIPIARVQGYSNSTLSQDILMQSNMDDFSNVDTTPELFQKLIEEPDCNAMNSREFEEYFKNLSLPSLGSIYSGTFEGLNDTAMDITTDGVGRMKTKKRVLSTKRGKEEISVAAEFSRVCIDDKRNSSTAAKDPESMDNVQFVKWAMGKLNKIKLQRLSPHIIAPNIAEIFSKKRETLDNPLHSAIISEMHDCIRTMLTMLGKGQHTSILNDTNNKKETPLHLAVIHNQQATVHMLLKLGVEPNALTSEGKGALHLAVEKSHDECISELLNKSNYTSSNHTLDCNLPSHEGCTPLHIAARDKNISAIVKLVNAGADVNKKDTTCGRTVLHIAVEEGNKAITRYLLENTNIEVNASNLSGNTALHQAVVGGLPTRHLVELLLKHKADPMKQNHVSGKRGVEVDSGQEVGFIEIKEEPESDDDECELRIADDSEDEDGQEGQTPLDLASDDQELLELLKNFQPHMYTASTDDDGIVIKEEPLDSPELEGVLKRVNNCLFDAGTMDKLCAILDKSGSWVNLAELLDHSFLINSIKDSPSPSKMLLNFADLHGNTSAQDIRGFLEALDEYEAVQVLDSGAVQ